MISRNSTIAGENRNKRKKKIENNNKKEKIPTNIIQMKK